MKKIKIYLATDHAGFKLKNKVQNFLKEKDFLVEDFGAFKYDIQDDYPDFISLVAQKISEDYKKKDATSLAIIFGGSGQGEAMCANRFKNVRATVYYHHNEEILIFSKEHNNANILSIGARFVDEKVILEDIIFWIEKSFLKENRHQKRIKKF